MSDIDERGNMYVIGLFAPFLAPHMFYPCSVVEHAKKLGWADEFRLSANAAEVLKKDAIARKVCAKNLTEKGKHISLTS